MKKARFSSQQQTVTVLEDTDKYYIFICLNEEKKTEKLENVDKELEYFEYDYVEIVEFKENIDIKDVKDNPSKYLHYTNSKKLADIKATKLKEISKKCEDTIYNGVGQPCKYYSVEDIQKLITAAMTFVSYNTTYCNSLNMWIKAETDSTVIESIYYGIDIPETYQSDVLKKYLSSKNK